MEVGYHYNGTVVVVSSIVSAANGGGDFDAATVARHTMAGFRWYTGATRRLLAKVLSFNQVFLLCSYGQQQ